jgi:hypothetical protein
LLLVVLADAAGRSKDAGSVAQSSETNPRGTRSGQQVEPGGFSRSSITSDSRFITNASMRLSRNMVNISGATV